MLPREAKQKLTHREAAELFHYCTLNPLDDRSNFQMPIASLHASFLNANRDPKKQRAFTMNDCLLFKPADEETDIDALLIADNW